MFPSQVDISLSLSSSLPLKINKNTYILKTAWHKPADPTKRKKIVQGPNLPGLLS